MANRRSEHPGVYLIRRAGKWRGRYKDIASGKMVQEDLTAYQCHTRPHAEQWAKLKSRWLQERRLRLDVKGGEIRAMFEVDQLITAYLESLRSEFGDDRARIEDSFLSHSFKPWLFARKLKACGYIDKILLNAYRGSVAERSIANSTKTRYLAAARSLLLYGADEGFLLIDADEVSKCLKRFESENVAAPTIIEASELRSMITFLAERELVTLPNGERKYARLVPSIFFLMLTGCRLQEAMNAQWAGVSWTRKTIRIKKNQATDWKTKTKRDRDIGFADSPALERMLNALRHESGPYILTGEDPNKPRYWSGPTWRRTRAGTGFEQLTPKDLRSTFATAIAMAKNGPKAQAAAKRLGHSIATAEEYYIDGAVEPEGDTVEEWLGVKEDLDRAMGRLGW